MMNWIFRHLWYRAVFSGLKWGPSPKDSETFEAVICEPESIQTVVGRYGKIVRVIDGDTLVVEIDNNRYPIRLLGVNTPEIWTKEGKEVKDLLIKFLNTYDCWEVFLERDHRDRDKYGRLLRYVWLPNFNHLMLNELILYFRWSKPYMIHSLKYKKVFQKYFFNK